jgi:predicted dehydrogenase
MTLVAPALRVAVVGAGRMGQNHLRIYDLLKGVAIAAVVDADRAQAEAAARRYGCPIFDSLDQLVGKVDAASVCVPSALHGEVGRFLLANGIPCLIEKPLASTDAECRSLIDTAARAKVALLVGHVERFNPAVQQLADLLEGGHRVHAIDARRLSWASARITDVDVVLDLMVHDLDIVLWLMNKPISGIAASGVCTSGSEGQDYVTALLSFSDGVMASLTASRITQTKVRELYLTADFGYVTVNYLNQEVLVFRHGGVERGPSHWSNAANAVIDSVMERVLVRNAEPLMVELQHFMDVVRNGAKPLVTGEHALETLRVAGCIRAEIAKTARG